jgi:hypothetical protein
MAPAVPKNVRLSNTKLIKEMRSSVCEVCEQETVCDLHHIMSVGSGGPDHKFNLISLCKWNCHIKAHNGILSRKLLFSKVAVREGLLYENVIATVMDLKT